MVCLVCGSVQAPGFSIWSWEFDHLSLTWGMAAAQYDAMGIGQAVRNAMGRTIIFFHFSSGGAPMRYRARMTLLAFALITSLAAGEIHAGILLDNLDQTDDGVTTAISVGGSILTGNSDISLSSVVIPQSLTGFLPGETLTLASRNADGTVGSLLPANFSLLFDSSTSMTTALVTSPLTLQSNSGYWFLLNSDSGDSVGWDYTFSTTYMSTADVTLPVDDVAYGLSVIPPLIEYFNLADGPQLMQLNGTAVPEPSSLALCTIAGVLGLLVDRVRRKRSA